MTRLLTLALAAATLSFASCAHKSKSCTSKEGCSACDSKAKPECCGSAACATKKK